MPWVCYGTSLISRKISGCFLQGIHYGARRSSEVVISRFGLDPEKIRVQLEAASLGIAIQSKFLQRVTMHSVPVLRVFRQKALHRHLCFTREFHVKMPVNMPYPGHRLSNKVCIQYVKKAPMGIAVILAELNGKV